MNKDIIRDYELDIIVKAWRDESFRQKLLKNAKAAIEEEFEIEVPSDIKISVHEESEESIHLIVPSVPSNFITDDFSDEELKDVIGGVMSSNHGVSFYNDKKLKELKKENEQLKKDLLKLTKKH